MARLKLFAALRDAAGTAEVEIKAENAAEVLERARAMFGDVFSAQAARATVALNGEEISKGRLDELAVGPADEVALLPPVSGGSERVDPASTGFAWNILFATSISVASWLSAALLTWLLAAAAAGVTLLLGRKATGSSGAGTLVAALASATFPLWLYGQGEAGLMWAATTAVLVTSSALVVSRPRLSAVKAAGALIWLPLYIGLGLSYAVLIRQQQTGHRLLMAAALILVAIKASPLVTTRMLKTSPGGPQVSRWAVTISGIAAAVGAAMVSLMFLDRPFGPGPLAVLALTAALAAALGEAAGRMVSGELMSQDARFPPLMALDAWLFALPAFFYGFRLYLT